MTVTEWRLPGVHACSVSVYVHIAEARDRIHVLQAAANVS
jgi:hypothetical protein